jgi:hypothetical protein
MKDVADGYNRARICKRLWSPGIAAGESIQPAYVAWRAGRTLRVVVPARQAVNRFLDSLKGLQIRADEQLDCYMRNMELYRQMQLYMFKLKFFPRNFLPTLLSSYSMCYVTASFFHNKILLYCRILISTGTQNKKSVLFLDLVYCTCYSICILGSGGGLYCLPLIRKEHYTGSLAK